MDARKFVEGMVEICNSHEHCMDCPIVGLCHTPQIILTNYDKILGIIESETEIVYWVTPKLFLALQVLVKDYEKRERTNIVPYFSPSEFGGFAIEKNLDNIVPFKISRKVLRDLLSLINSTHQTGLMTVFPSKTLSYKEDFVLKKFHEAVEKTIETMGQF